MRTQLPEPLQVMIGPDVSRWLYEVADDRYDGDVIKALRVQLKVAMIVHHNPERPWAGVEYEDGTFRKYR